MKPPVIMLLDDEPHDLETVREELRKRYSADYDIDCDHSAAAALERLAALKDSGGDLALVLSAPWTPEMDGPEFLRRAHDLFPDARRLIVLDWNDQYLTGFMAQCLNEGTIDDYIARPWVTPDEEFHRAITKFLDRWARSRRPHFETVRVIGDQWSPRSHELRDLLDRNGVRYGFYDKDSPQGSALLAREGVAAGPFPVLIFYDGMILHDPTNLDVADTLGASYEPGTQLYDVTIVGAGPAGLAAAVYGASEGLDTLVIEREAIGGQAGTSSLIRNYMGFPRGISGGELTNRASTQAWLFGARFCHARQATGLHAMDGHYVLSLSDGKQVHTRAAVLAMGMAYRRLNIPALDALHGAGVYYGAAVTEGRAMQDQPVYVVGAGNSAGQAAVHLAKFAAQVTLVVRSDSLAASMSDYLIKELDGLANVRVCFHTEVVDGEGSKRLERLTLRNNRTGEEETVPAAGLFVLIGGEPHTRWLPEALQRDRYGYIITGRDLLEHDRACWSLERGPLPLETSLPGVFAAGDVRFRSVKRVASAVGEGSIVIQLVHEYLAGPA